MSSAPTIATENGLQHDDGDVPVNKKTTFNGQLNQYFHTSKPVTDAELPSSKAASTGLPTPAPTPSTNSDSRKRKTQDEEYTTKREEAHPRERSKRRPKAPTPASPTSRIVTRSRSAPLTSPSPSLPTPTTATPPSQPTTPSTPSTPSTTNSLLRDTIPPNLTLLLVGVNPGIQTGQTGFAYAHPSNLFWKLLHSSGITRIRHPPSDTYRLPALYNIGNTNIVERATRDASMLTRAEMNAGVPVLEAKIAAQRPEVVCLVGKSIWEAVWRVRRGRAIRKEEFRYGWQDEGENMGRSAEWAGARVFVATTTSGLAAGMSRAEKQAVWDELGEWVVRRREERGG
ncbi:uracil-DNA glycosylase-like protein [Aspergillus taichungensis]|uniref:Uracil-DNA glycosylase-like protein n=1 Tax=Aspergillus taichungensis TaxID=482145 RepID=A0A2J5HGW1_9EURO|nr:uracil-DNA glycosylase-like protein [Aspergillus taichungensis]